MPLTFAVCVHGAYVPGLAFPSCRSSYHGIAAVGSVTLYLLLLLMLFTVAVF